MEENIWTNFLSLCFFSICTITIISYLFVDITAQVSFEEFSIDDTCSYSEKNPLQITDGQNVKDNFIIYDNSSLGFRVIYPYDWKITEEHCILENQGMIYSSSNLNFISTPESKDYGLIGISVADFFVDMPIDTFMDIYGTDFGDSIESKEIINFAGRPAAKFIFNEGDHDRLLITTFTNDRKYDITFPIINWFSNHTMQSMLNSFEIITSDAGNSTYDNLMNELG